MSKHTTAWEWLDSHQFKYGATWCDHLKADSDYIRKLEAALEKALRELEIPGVGDCDDIRASVGWTEEK